MCPLNTALMLSCFLAQLDVYVCERICGVAADSLTNKLHLFTEETT